MLTIEITTDPAALERLVPDWAALDASLSPRTPFSSPGWAMTWWRHFGRDQLSARDHLQVFSLRDADKRLVAVAPMMLTHRPAVGPIRTRELQFLGADPYMTELRGPICRPEDVAAVVEALEGHLLSRKHSWDTIQWRGVRKTDAVAPWLARTLTGEAVPDLLDHYLPLPASWDAFRAALPRNIKESLRKCYNSLARDGHAFELRVKQAPDDSDAAIQQFFDLHSSRAGQTDTISHIDVFATPRSRAFLLEHCRDLAARDALRVFQLVIGEAVVATRIGIVLGDEIYLYYSGYDMAWGRYSVMTTLVAEAIKWSIEHGFRIVNLSTGTDVSKTRWRPEQVAYAGGFQKSQSLRADIAVAALSYMRARKAG